MKYLIMAVFVDAGGFGDAGEICTYSKVKGLASRKPKDCAAEIIKDICKSSKLSQDDLVELFVFQSAKDPKNAPKLVASWDLDDGLFGDIDDNDDDFDDDDDDDVEIDQSLLDFAARDRLRRVRGVFLGEVIKS